MKPAPFDYVAPQSLAEAAMLLGQHGGDARILAGGQSLIAMLNMRVATPSLLIDITRCADADYIRDEGDTIAIGCATRQFQLERWPGLADKLPVVAKALPYVGHAQTRSRGTVCGSIAHADPSSELPLCLALLNGDVVLQSHKGQRTLRAEAYFDGVMQTARRDDELIAEIRLPVQRPDAGVAFHEMAMRHGDFAVVSVAAQATPDDMRLAIGGVADKPIVKQFARLAAKDLDAALNEVAWSLALEEDLHATPAYRRHLVRTLGKRALMEAVA